MSESYLNLWNFTIAGETLTHWINDGLMTPFFLLIGLELKVADQLLEQAGCGGLITRKSGESFNIDRGRIRTGDQYLSKKVNFQK